MVKLGRLVVMGTTEGAWGFVAANLARPIVAVEYLEWINGIVRKIASAHTAASLVNSFVLPVLILLTLVGAEIRSLTACVPRLEPGSTPQAFSPVAVPKLIVDADSAVGSVALVGAVRSPRAPHENATAVTAMFNSLNEVPHQQWNRLVQWHDAPTVS